MKQRLLDALRASTADYADIRIDEVNGTSFSYRANELDQTSTGRTLGGLVRACYRGGWGTVVFSSLDELPRKVEEACQAARLVGKEQTLLAETAAPRDYTGLATFKHDFRDIPLSDKLATLNEYNDLLRTSVPGIQSSVASYAEAMRTTWFASTRGNTFMEERPRITLVLAAIARDGSLVQNAFRSFSSATDFDIILNRHDLARELAREAIALLKAPQCPSGKYTVILDNSMTGLFTHEAFGHLSEADFLYENKDMRELMQIGRVMGNKHLNITDDGSRGSLIGTHRLDDEGTPTQRTELIRDGVLAGHLHSLETAARMNETPTGNARAISYGCSPLVRMTNTFIEPGPLTKDELFRDVDDGIYVCGGLGGQTQMEMFTFTASHGYRIRNGQIAELLRDVTLTGNVFQTLHDIDGIANDLEIIEQGGGCGKGGQSPLPVTDGGPHVRIRDVVIGGR